MKNKLVKRMKEKKKENESFVRSEDTDEIKPRRRKIYLFFMISSLPIIIGVLLFYGNSAYLDLNVSNENLNEPIPDIEVDYKTVYNENELKYKDRIDEAEKLIESRQYYKALKLFDSFCDKIPKSIRCLYGKASTIDKISEIEESNEKLMKCIDLYKKLFSKEILNEAKLLNLHLIAGERLLNRLQFFGKTQDAIAYNKLLIELFPDNLKLHNELGISYLIKNDGDSAKEKFEHVLQKSPNDPTALVHYGFILKQIDRKINESISYLKRGIDTLDEKVNDGRFFYHLGDALQRFNRNEEAYHYYQIGANNGLFPSAYQRSLYNEPFLRAKPWWTLEETGYAKYLKLLEEKWQLIRDEAFGLINKSSSLFSPEDENLREKGDWKQFNLYVRGKKIEENCKRAPIACNLVDQIIPAKTCKRGQIKFSIMQPGVHVYPHCGPTNCRIRAHLGLKVPKGPLIRVVNETKEWIEGKFIIFDDSFEHEVWHNGDEFRLVLIVDLWHPDLTDKQKAMLTPI